MESGSNVMFNIRVHQNSWKSFFSLPYLMILPDCRSGDTAAVYGRSKIFFDDPVPFQRYRSSVIMADYMKTMRSVDLGRCLDECLRQTTTKCVDKQRSIELDVVLYNTSESNLLTKYLTSPDVSLRRTTLTKESVDWADMIRVDQESYTMRRMIITKTW